MSHLSPDSLPLVIGKAFLLSGVQNSSRVGDRHTVCVTHTMIAGGESETAHSKDKNQQTVRSHVTLTCVRKFLYLQVTSSSLLLRSCSLYTLPTQLAFLRLILSCVMTRRRKFVNCFVSRLQWNLRLHLV